MKLSELLPAKTVVNAKLFGQLINKEGALTEREQYLIKLLSESVTLEIANLLKNEK